MAIRRFSALPTLSVLLAVSGVVIVDAPPNVPAQGAPFGKICIVGETEDGPMNVPTDLLSDSDQATIFGLFGFQYGSSKYQNACARKSGGAEYWNGNIWVQSYALRFAALTIVRVDTSIGTVQFTPRAFVQSSLVPLFNVTPGGTFIWKRDTVTKTATFAATAASVVSVSGSFTAFVGGETLAISVDGGTPIVVTFQASDTSGAAIASRINAAFGFALATFSSQLTLTSATKGTGSHVQVSAGAAATTLGLPTTVVNGTGDAVNIALVTLAELAAKITATDSGSAITAGPTGAPRLISKTAGTGSIQVLAGTSNASLGFVDATAGSATTAALTAAVTIPAGTRLSDGTTPVVTMQTTAIPVGSVATTNLKVRPALDDGSYLGATSSTVTTLVDQPGGIEWSVGNIASLSAALTPSQLDSAYLTAIAATVGIGNDTTKKINGIVSARQSNAIRGAVQANAIFCGANGHFDRRSFMSAPVNATAQTIIGAAAPGIGAYRAEQNTYCGGGVRKFIQQLADGGYDATGRTLVHADVMMASRWSTLAPGLNPGQLPEDAQFQWSNTTFPGLDDVASTWDLSTYAAFKVAGVCGIQYDQVTGLTFEQGVTAVDPSADPTHVDISRRTLEGYISDSLSNIFAVKAKRQGTEKRREAGKVQIDGLLEGLQLGEDAVVDTFATSFSVDKALPKVVIYQISVDPVQSDDVIVLNMSVGPNSVEIARAA